MIGDVPARAFVDAENEAGGPVTKSQAGGFAAPFSDPGGASCQESHGNR